MTPLTADGTVPTDHSALGLTVLSDLAQLAAVSRGEKSAAAGLMELFSAKLSTSRGMVGYLTPRGKGSQVLTTLEMSPGDIAIFREGALEKNGSCFLFPEAAEAPARPGSGTAAAEGRDGIAFFGALVPGRIEGTPFVVVDSIFGDGVDPAEDLKLLAAAAAVLGPVFKKRRKKKKVSRREKPLGRILQKHIRAWVEPLDPSRTLLRSDLYERVIAEVEKILLVEALKKTNHVQTEAARFLGINRNTLSRKMKKYGLAGE